MNTINLRKKVYADGRADVRAEIYRDNEMVTSKLFFNMGLFISDAKEREKNFIKAHKWADDFLNQMKEYEVHPKGNKWK